MPASGVAGHSSYYAFRANSTYDPDYTGTGHQPNFRDECAATYIYYTVLAAKITVTYPNQDSDSQLMGVFVDDYYLTEDTASEICENHVYNKTCTPSKAQGGIVFTAYFNAPRWEKTTLSAYLADDVNKVAVDSNHSKARYFVIWRAPVAPSVTLAAQYVFVEIQYTVLWRDVQVTGRS